MEPVTPKHILHIKKDVGTSWAELGVELLIEEAELRKLIEDYYYDSDRAEEVLTIWKERIGKDATVERLATAFNKIGEKNIAEKLLGMYMKCVGIKKSFCVAFNNDFATLRDQVLCSLSNSFSVFKK